MEEIHFYDITDVCRMFGTTSRTLRFYEEKKIITSTTVGISARRRYSEEQVLQIRRVLTLRKIGLSVQDIVELQSQKSDLKEAVLSKRAEIYASIDSRLKKIHILDEVLCALNLGKDIFDEDISFNNEAKSEDFEIAKICTDAIVNQKDEVLYQYLSPQLIQYMPPDVYHAVWRDTFAPLGGFVSIEKIFADKKQPNKLKSKVQYSNIGLLITFVFNGGVIDGLWLNYYDVEEMSCV